MRLLFDASQSITHIAAFRSLYPTLREVAKLKKEVTWDVHICSASQMSGLDDMADGEFKVLSLKGKEVRLNVKEREGRLIDAVEECFMYGAVRG